jgi:TolA-binding protein
MSKAHIFIKNKDYKAAIEPLKKIVDGSPNDLWADDAAFLLGDLYQKHLNDNNTAKSWYQKIILNYTSSLWINEARKRFQELRSNDNATS